MKFLSLFIYKKYTFFRALAGIFFDLKNLRQILNPKEIPFVIINFNQLHRLKKLIDFAQKRGFKRIVILDNLSTYPPLLEYYKSIENVVTVEKMDKNYGHLVFLQNKDFMKKYGRNFFILTDADIEPNENLSRNFMRKMIWILLKYSQNILKVGFALRIDDIPYSYPQREKVLAWEKKFWKKQITKNVYEAPIDTTFALYKPNMSKFLTEFSNFYLAVRLAGNYTARHGGWYLDYNNLSDEEKYYIESANKSSSWITAQKNNNRSYL